jgi:hypothetical protein
MSAGVGKGAFYCMKPDFPYVPLHPSITLLVSKPVTYTFMSYNTICIGRPKIRTTAEGRKVIL